MIAYVRALSPHIARCELSFLQRDPIDPGLAQRQHQGYLAALGELGCELKHLPPLPEHPDAVFVEDTAVIVPELTVITRPGVDSRRDEVDSVAATLAGDTRLARVREPGTLEGGDVLRIGHALYAGLSGRTNADGVAQLGSALAPSGYSVQGVTLTGCLHLKSAVTFIPPATVLVNPDWIDAGLFRACRVISVDPQEPFGANTLTVNGVTLVSSLYPRTRARLESAGIATRALEVGELHKAEAALTCMSLVFGD